MTTVDDSSEIEKPSSADDGSKRGRGRGRERSPENMPRVTLGPHFEMHPVVFPSSAVIVLGLVLLAFLFPGDLQKQFVDARNWIGSHFGWLYVASMSGFLGFTAWLAFGRFGRVKLGADDEKPEFNRLTWFTMLFSAGMGIGLVFWSVAEPIDHFNITPPGFAEGIEPARLSTAVTVFHWGLHPWALYAFVGLALAYFGFRRGMPLGFRSLMYPLLGNRVWGRTGDAIDTLAIIATLTGVATSLGLGAMQVNAGLAFLFGMPIGVLWQVLLIAGITAVATVSVVLGLGTGIRRLSEFNMSLAGLLLVLVILASGVIAFLGATIENTGAYLQLLPFNSFRTGAFSDEGREWLNSWTVFYWAWWISWSPFVGMFIARVSRGRSIREFVTGTVFVPTMVGLVWLTAFGTTTLRQHTDHIDAERQAQQSAVASAADTDSADTGSADPYERDIAGSGTGELPTYMVATSVDGDGNPVRNDEGVYPSEERALTAVEYLGAPVTTNEGRALLDRDARVSTVLFVLLDSLFSTGVLSTVAIGAATLCIILFFVTSSDSASLVIDIIASGGNADPPVGTRLFWAITEGTVAATLLVAGGERGLQALQAASITAALPFVFILLFAAIGLTQALFRYEAAAKPGPAAAA